MSSLPINIVDLIVIVVLLLSALLALFRGIVIGISGLLALFLTILFVVKGTSMFPATAALAWAVLA